MIRPLFHDHTTNKGFTIVELLIVIVVIAILASVTTLAFNGIKDRATNSNTVTTVSSIEKALKMHMASTGLPLEISDADSQTYGQGNYQTYRGSIGMRAVCIGGSWPTPNEMAYELDGASTGYYNTIKNNDSNDIYQYYCSSWNAHGQMVIALNEAVKRSPEKLSFPKMKQIDSLKMVVDNPYNPGTTMDVYVRGVRYAFNGSSTAPVSYLFYPVAGKTCTAPDVSIDYGTSNGSNIGPGATFPGYTSTGADYTRNNTQMCMRTIRY